MPLKNLVEAGKGEHEIQAHLRDNLEVLGNACTFSALQGEYIAFSQYPILEGKADLVVFTGRSRMTIVIAEIKGADFNFLTKDGSISSEINFAAQQIRSRFQAIESNYEYFRRRFHEVRKEVEEGATKYGSFLGPSCPLHVDPNKDIWWQGMVIGGRSSKDYEESRLRQALERSSPHITYDTWDGWLRSRATYGDSLRTNYPKDAG